MPDAGIGRLPTEAATVTLCGKARRRTLHRTAKRFFIKTTQAAPIRLP